MAAGRSWPSWTPAATLAHPDCTGTLLRNEISLCPATSWRSGLYKIPRLNARVLLVYDCPANWDVNLFAGDSSCVEWPCDLTLDQGAGEGCDTEIG